MRAALGAAAAAAAADPPAAAVLAAAACLLLRSLLLLLWPRAAAGASRRGFGSGENGFWNRRIRTERPVHARKHHRLEKTWVYTGAAAAPSLEACARGLGAAESARDAAFRAPLTGHLAGRQTWQALPASHPLKAVQDALAFDPSANVNAGDKLLRAQQLAAASRDPLLANPAPPRGAPSVSPQAALELGWDFYATLQCEDGHFAGDYVRRRRGAARRGAAAQRPCQLCARLLGPPAPRAHARAHAPPPEWAAVPTHPASPLPSPPRPRVLLRRRHRCAGRPHVPHARLHHHVPRGGHPAGRPRVRDAHVPAEPPADGACARCVRARVACERVLHACVRAARACAFRLRARSILACVRACPCSAPLLHPPPTAAAAGSTHWPRPSLSAAGRWLGPPHRGPLDHVRHHHELRRVPVRVSLCVWGTC